MRCRKKKTGSFLLIALLAVLGECILLPQAYAKQPAPFSAADMFAGETLYYTIDFWLLRGSATGELCFTKTPDGYRALFVAETKGVLRLVAGYRKEIMESLMEYDPAAQRLRPRLFRETFVQDTMEYKREIAYDYERGAFTCIRTSPRGKPRVTQAALPGNVFEDLLTLFYNIRMGCYGALNDGVRLKVPVIMKEQPSCITLDCPAQGTKDRRRGFNAALTMDRNLTHARSKSVLVLLDDDAVLKSALVIDAYFFGDLGVRLTGRTYH
ncbi:MAG: DUF3108 domain-containing protein [Deltaproteobacteria bacterium]|nr:DUF3108 domain-containing protein [Deltaproteobacteria bacterium]